MINFVQWKSGILTLRVYGDLLTFKLHFLNYLDGKKVGRLKH